jgi:hypothetical protein
LNIVNPSTKQEENKMGQLLKKRHNFLTGKSGFGTLEIVIIIAVILSIALLFRSTLSHYATTLIESVFSGDPLAN